ncbi:hypothetical protein BDV40DRAFT_263939 [Aspergillus tamarii]|uniref:Uncharacterized protein n=1 Tax=Aspergillus tamarii TaxID=41984 RepID=A0A5N6UWE3_ASPTM|nr:hypothetical protein BDV40DRAFT_263939 [Aspergillus tamarii]
MASKALSPSNLVIFSLIISHEIPSSLLRGHHWDVFLQLRLITNPLIHLLRMTRIFGPGRICPLLILTGTFHLSTPKHSIFAAITALM